MRLKLFLRLYLSILLVLFNVFIINPLSWLSPIYLLLYGLMLYVYNEVGHYNLKITILLGLIILINLLNNGFVITFYLHSLLSLTMLLMHIPARKSVYRLFGRIINSNNIRIYRDRIECDQWLLQSEIYLREREMMRLRMRIQLKYKHLRMYEIKYIDNEIFGDHFYVNIR